VVGRGAVKALKKARAVRGGQEVPDGAALVPDGAALVPDGVARGDRGDPGGRVAHAGVLALAGAGLVRVARDGGAGRKVSSRGGGLLPCGDGGVAPGARRGGFQVWDADSP
jgi:hypothetical protein